MINVLHLYYDLLNLYGENANIRCIENQLKLNNIKVNIDLKSINETINFDKYDFIYIGSGSEENIEIALNDLLRRKKEIKEYIESNKFLLLTGNSPILFGKYIKTLEDKKEALAIFEYHSKYINNTNKDSASKTRIVGETLSQTNLIEEKIIGFQNRCDLLLNVKTPLFKTLQKYSNNLESEDEGFTYKNVYATHTIGPLLIRNPHFTNYLLNKLCEQKQLKYKIYDETAIKAYNKYLDNFIN